MSETKPYIDDNQPTELCRHNLHPERCIYKGCGYRLALEENARLKVAAPAAHAGKLHIDPEAPRDILAEDGELVATAYNPIAFAGGQYGNDPAAVALARQFAASGEMLEALRKCVRWMENYAPALTCDSLASARAALAAAEGK